MSGLDPCLPIYPQFFKCQVNCSQTLGLRVIGRQIDGLPIQGSPFFRLSTTESQETLGGQQRRNKFRTLMGNSNL